MPHVKRVPWQLISDMCHLPSKKAEHTNTVLILEYKDGYFRVLTKFQAAEGRVYHSHIFTMFLNVFANPHYAI